MNDRVRQHARLNTHQPLPTRENDNVLRYRQILKWSITISNYNLVYADICGRKCHGFGNVTITSGNSASKFKQCLWLWSGKRVKHLQAYSTVSNRNKNVVAINHPNMNAYSLAWRNKARSTVWNLTFLTFTEPNKDSELMRVRDRL